jgi:hypothetical protein
LKRDVCTFSRLPSFFHPSSSPYFLPYFAFLEDPTKIKILLQIRAGDKAIANQNNTEYFRKNVQPIVNAFTDCALAMEAKIKSTKGNADKAFVWYLMADSASTRDYVQTKFGDKVFSK